MQTILSLLKSSEATPDTITDLEIGKLRSLRESRTLMKQRLAELEDDLASHEKDLIARLESGAVSESQDTLTVKTTERRYPSWKDAFVSRLGEIEARKVTDSTTPTISKSIIISSK